MSRLFRLFVLGGAGLFLTPVAASAQFVRPFGLPGGAPLTVPIVPPVQLVPTVRIVQPVSLVTPVIGWPRQNYFYHTHYRLGNLHFNNTQVSFGSAWALRPVVPVYVQSTPYMTGSVGGGRTDAVLLAYENLAKAQREATRVASLTIDNRVPIAVVPGDAGLGDPVRKALAPADAASVTSGEALNEVMKEIVRAESKGAKGPSAYIPPLLSKDIRFAGSAAADLLNFVRQSSLELPGAFDAPALASQRDELVKEFDAVAEALRAGKPADPKRAARLEFAFQRFEQAAAPVIKDLKFEDAAEARRFLNRLGGAVKALKGGAANGLVDPNWATEGLTGAELVKHMTKHKLQFGPAPRGAAEGYETIHRNLAAYLFVLTEPKK